MVEERAAVQNRTGATRILSAPRARLEQCLGQATLKMNIVRASYKILPFALNPSIVKEAVQGKRRYAFIYISCNIQDAALNHDIPKLECFVCLKVQKNESYF